MLNAAAQKQKRKKARESIDLWFEERFMGCIEEAIDKHMEDAHVVDLAAKFSEAKHFAAAICSVEMAEHIKLCHNIKDKPFISTRLIYDNPEDGICTAELDGRNCPTTQHKLTRVTDDLDVGIKRHRHDASKIGQKINRVLLPVAMYEKYGQEQGLCPGVAKDYTNMMFYNIPVFSYSGDEVVYCTDN